MHPMFPDRYRLVNMNPDGELLKKRWTAVERTAAKAKPDLLLDLVNLVFARAPKAPASVGEFCAFIRQEDAAFPLRDNELELRVLAANVLVAAWAEPSSHKADSLALLTTTAALRGVRPMNEFREYLDEARAYLASESSSVREFELPDNVPELPKYVDELGKVSGSGGDVATLTKHAHALFEALIRDAGSCLQAAQEAVVDVRHGMKVALEESNILWWVFGESSRDLDKPLAEIHDPYVAFVIAKEMADLTTLLPGPRNTRALLGRALQSARSSPERTTIRAAVSTVPQRWRETIVAAQPPYSGDLHPLLTAIVKANEVDGPDTWVPLFEKATGIRADTEMHALDLCIQFYEECISLRTLTAWRGG